jgi:phosphoribosylglycinamide formyltransferase-1
MNAPSKCRLGILLSGRGSNFAALQKAISSGTLIHAEVAVVVSNHPDAVGLSVAESQGLKTVALDKSKFESRQAFDQAITDALQAHQVDLVILAGYDRILGNALLAAYPGKILNIHPSLLPAYGGKGMVGHKVHQSVLENNETESGCSVHLVTEIVDGGGILGQSRVPVLSTDTPETLAARVLEQEHQLYPRVIGEFIQQQLAQREDTKASHEHETLSSNSIA